MTAVGRVIAAIVLTCWLASSATAQTPGATLPSQCYDQRVAPVNVILACGDAGFIAQDLVWSTWGAEQASATGIASVKTCVPDCATGGRDEYPLALVAEELRDCNYGKPQYTRVVYSFPATSPFPPGSPGAEDPMVLFPCPRRPHADPKIKRMRMWMTSHNPRPNGYFVRVHIRLHVCAVRGRSEVVFRETKRLGGQTFGEHTRTLRFRQRVRCQSRTFRWKLRDEFFGIGTYRVRATVRDKDAQSSKTVSRKFVTLD